jgi:hypothetical protein
VYRTADGNIYRMDKRQHLNLLDSRSLEAGLPIAWSWQRVDGGYGVVTFERPASEAWVGEVYYNAVIPTYELDDLVTLSPAYITCMEYGLAAILGVHFGSPNEMVAGIAKSRLERIQMHNIKVPTLETDYPLRGVYDINTDSWV